METHRDKISLEIRGQVSLVYNRYKNNPFAIVVSHGIDPQDASSPININASFEGGYSVDISDESRLSFLEQLPLKMSTNTFKDQH